LKSKIDDSKNIHNTFQPNISPKARSISRDKSTTADRLHNAAGAGRVLVENTTKDADLFRPTISKRAESLDRSSPSDTSARLYASKDIYKQNLDNKKADEAKRNAEKCSFTPLMSTKARRPSLFTSSSSTDTPKSNVADRLSLSGEKSKNKIEEAKKNKLDKEMIELTFQPKLVSSPKNSNSKSFNPKNGTSDTEGSSLRNSRDKTEKVVTGSRFDHLYKDAIKRKTDDPLLRARVDESHLTFKPTISPKARSSSVERNSSELVASMHNANGAGRVPVTPVPKDTNLYKPAITMRAGSLDRSASGNIADRLYRYKDIQTENLERKKLEEELKEFEECTFAPLISPSNKDRLSISTSDSGGSPEPLDTVERLLQYGEKAKFKLQEERRLAAERGLLDVTFNPTLVSAQLSPDSSAKRNQFDRLYNDAIKRKTDDPLVRARVDESDITFKPSISEFASSIDRSTFEEINLRQKEHARKKKEDEVQRRAQEAIFTHQPVITKRANSLDRSNLDRISVRQKEQMEKEKEKTARRTALENTFAPRIPVFNSSKVKSTSIDFSESLGVSSTNSKGRICSPTSASIAGRFTKTPSPVNPMIALIEEERRLKADRVQSGHAPTSPHLSPRASPYNQKTLLRSSLSKVENMISSFSTNGDSTNGENTVVASDDMISSHDQFSQISEATPIDDLELITPNPKASSKSLSNSKSSVKPVANGKLSISEQIRKMKNEREAVHQTPKKSICDPIPPYKATGRSV
jgi:hypothetical protein